MTMVIPVFVLVIFGTFEIYRVFSVHRVLFNMVQGAAANAAKLHPVSGQQCEDVIKRYLERELSITDSEFKVVDVVLNPVGGSFPEVFELIAWAEVDCVFCRALRPILPERENVVTLRATSFFRPDHGVSCAPLERSELLGGAR